MHHSAHAAKWVVLRIALWELQLVDQGVLVGEGLEYGSGSPARKDPAADESVSQLYELTARLEG
jgi:hypothetical protein